MKSLYIIGDRPENVFEPPGWYTSPRGMDNMSRDIISAEFLEDIGYKSIWHKGYFFIDKWCKSLKVVRVL